MKHDFTIVIDCYLKKAISQHCLSIQLAYYISISGPIHNKVMVTMNGGRAPFKNY